MVLVKIWWSQIKIFIHIFASKKSFTDMNNCIEVVMLQMSNE